MVQGTYVPVGPVQEREAQGSATVPDHPPWLRELWHYDPAFMYDTDRYEYGEWHTTDPYYIEEDVRVPTGTEHGNDLDKARRNLDRFFAVVPDRELLPQTREVIIRGLPDIPVPGQERARRRIAPDLVLWPPGTNVSHRRSMLYGNGGDGIPLVILEYLSPSTASKDLQDNPFIYEAMGVQEYWVCDPEVPGSLHGYQRNDAGAWVRAEPATAGNAEDGPVFWSQVLGTYIRNSPQYGFQAQHPATGEWIYASVHDREEGWEEGWEEGREKGREEGREEGVLETTIANLKHWVGFLWDSEQADMWMARVSSYPHDQVAAVLPTPEDLQQLFRTGSDPCEAIPFWVPPPGNDIANSCP